MAGKNDNAVHPGAGAARRAGVAGEAALLIAKGRGL